MPDINFDFKHLSLCSILSQIPLTLSKAMQNYFISVFFFGFASFMSIQFSMLETELEDIEIFIISKLWQKRKKNFCKKN